MVQCPKCQHEVKDDFGLVECNQCGHSFMLGMDGQISEDVPPMVGTDSHHVEESPLDNYIDEATVFPVAVDSEPAEDTPYVEPSSEGDFHEDIGSQVIDNFSSVSGHHNLTNPSVVIKESELDGFVDEFTSFKEQAGEEQEIIADHEPELNSSESVYTSLTEVKGQQDFANQVEEFNDERTNFLAEQILENSQQVEKQEQLMNVSEFANSEKSSVDEGLLKYNVFLAGINSHDIKNIVFEELADKKLFLDIDELKKSMSDGQLVIPSISAVKASVIINRLSHLPISILWDQHDIRKA